MFKGTDPGVTAIYAIAGREGRRLGSGFVGCEHLLLALASRPNATGHLLRSYRLSSPAIEEAVLALGRVPAAVAADRDAAHVLGVELSDDVAARLRPAPPVHRVFPLG